MVYYILKVHTVLAKTYRLKRTLQNTFCLSTVGCTGFLTHRNLGIELAAEGGWVL